MPLNQSILEASEFRPGESWIGLRLKTAAIIGAFGWTRANSVNSIGAAVL